MNKNKLSRFLLSTSVGIIATLGISEVTALSPAEEAVWQQAKAQQGAEIQAHRAAAVAHFKSTDATMTDAKALELANKVVLDVSGLSALNTLGDGNTTQLFEHFKDILVGGVTLTPEHFDDFLTRIADASTLQALGVADVRQLKSPEAERLVVPSQITTVKDAVHFAEQRKEAGEFEAAATFFLKARDLIKATNQTKAKEYAEKALLMYSEHFIHHVARVSSISAEKVTAAQALLVSVKTLAEETNTSTAYVRAASCAEELATAIHDLVLLEKAAKVKLEAAATVDAAAVTAASVKIAKLYVDVYNADIVSRDMHGKAADLNTEQARNVQLAAAADAMRLAVGALADAHIAKADAVFAGDTTVIVKLKEDALAFNAMYTELADTSGVTNEKLLKTAAASAKILNAKFKATWNARSRFAALSEEYNALNTQYLAIRDSIGTLLGSANGTYAAMVAGGEHHLGARDVAAVRLVNAERLHRDVLDKADVTPMVPADVTTAVDALSTYVADNGSIIVVNGLDDALKSALDESKADLIRAARIDAFKTVATERALVAKACAVQLEKIAAADATLAQRATRLEAYLTLARQANNKAAWEAGVTAADAVLAHVDVATIAAGAGGDEARLVKALALTAKAEALLKRNTVADDTLVAAVDADNALVSGFLFDANVLANAIDDANRAFRVRARKELRQTFETAVELHNAVTVKQGLRAAWATLENAYATDEVTVADTALVANVINGDATFVSEALSAFSGATTVRAAKGALKALTVNAGVTVEANGGNTALAAGDLRVTIGGVNYDNTTVVAAWNGLGGGQQTNAITFETAGGDSFVVDITVVAATTVNDLPDIIRKCAAGAGQAGTLAANYVAMEAAPAVAVDEVTLDSLDTVEKLYNHLVSKFSSIRAASATYKGYEAAAKAWEKARHAKAEWAKHEVDNLSAATTAAIFTAKRDAAGAAYTDAANFETSRLRALFSGAGRGLFVDGAFDALDEVVGVMAADNGRLGAFYVNEDVLTSLHRRAVSLESSAATYVKTRNAVGAEPLVPLNVARTAAIDAAIRGANVGAFEVATKLVNAAFTGLANYNDHADFGALIAERLAAVSAAYSKVNTAWLPNLTSTLALADAGVVQAHKDAIRDLLQDGAAVDAGVDLAGRVFSLGARFTPAGGANYVQTHSVRRNLTLGYETILKTLVSLVVADELDVHQGHLHTAMSAEATLARNLALTAYTANAAVTQGQMDQVLANIEQRAAMAEAIRAGVYSATRTNTPSNTTASFKAARAQAIDAVATLIPEGAQDTADIVLKETDVLATVNLKAKVAHELARTWVAKGGSEAMRYSNSGLPAHKETALEAFTKGLAAYTQEIELIMSTTTAGEMPNRNTRLLSAYEGISSACAEMIKAGITKADTAKEMHTATFKQAQILYREGHKTRALALLEGLVKNDAAKVVHGPILNELAAEYEAEGKFLKAARAFEASALNHVSRREAKEAFVAAESALSAARQSGHSEASQAAANAFNAIGAAHLHGRVRAEAYHKAAAAYILGGLYEEAATAYANSAGRWKSIGDHMQAGNQYEKAAWALSKVADITVDQRIALTQYIEKAAHQLQIVDATQRLEKLVTLAEEQIAKIENDDNIASGKLKTAVIAAAGALYEKALAFQKEGDLSHAEAGEARILALLKKVDANGKEAGILSHVGGLYVLQKKHAEAVNTYIKAAESYVEGARLSEAAAMYAKAAKAGLAGNQGARIKDEILPKLLEISGHVRTGGKHAGRHDQFEIHMAILETYQDLMISHPGEVDNAFAELTAIEKEAIVDHAVQAQLGAIKVALLSQKARVAHGADAKATLLKSAQAAFDAVKDLNGNSNVATAKVKNFITLAAHHLVEMYRHSKAIHSATDGLVQMAAFKAVVDAADNAALASYTAASTAKEGYEAALEASKRAARAMESYTRAMLHYVATEAEKARVDDMNSLRAMPDRMVVLAGNSVRATLLGILKARAEAKVMQANFVEVMDAVNKVNTYVAAMRSHPAAHDAHGDAVATPALKTAAAATPEAVKAVVADLGTHAADAHATLDPVERATKTDALVADKTEKVATAVVAGLQAHADLTQKAPAAEVSKTALADTTAAITTVVVGDGKTKGLLGDLQHAQTGPSTATQAVITK